MPRKKATPPTNQLSFDSLMQSPLKPTVPTAQCAICPIRYPVTELLPDGFCHACIDKMDAGDPITKIMEVDIAIPEPPKRFPAGKAPENFIGIHCPIPYELTPPSRRRAKQEVA